MAQAATSQRTQKQNVRGVSDSDLVRERFPNGVNPSQRSKTAGRVVHELLREPALLSQEWNWTVVSDFVKKQKIPTNCGGPMAITKTVCEGLAVLPPMDWELVGTEVPLGHARADQVWRAPDLKVVENHIGDVVVVEFKTASHRGTVELNDVNDQVNRLMAGALDEYGERLLGVALLALKSKSTSRLYLGDGSGWVPFTNGLVYDFDTRRLPPDEW